jgi:hypothetical protein
MDYPRWLVICLDDDGRRVLSTHRYFFTRDAADTYSNSIASGRDATVVEVSRPIRDQ